MPGTLKAFVGGQWIPILGGGGVNEVAISPDVPTDPNVELWYDTDDPGYSLANMALVEFGTYTPTLTGMVVGVGGTNSAEYLWVGGTGVGARGILSVRGQIIFGSSGQTFPTAPQITIPPGFNYNAANAERLLGQCNLNDVSALNTDGVVWANSATTVRPLCKLISGGTLIYFDVLGPTKPFTWAASDRIIWNFVVDAVRV